MAGIEAWKNAHPEPIAPPNLAYGTLPEIVFPTQTPSSTFTYTLENIEGKPPNATPSAKVYFMPKKAASLLAPAKAREFAQKLGFTDDAQLLSPTRYLFTDPNTTLRTLDLDIINLNFLLKYDFTKDLTIFDNANLPNQDRAISEAKNFLQLNRLFSEEMINGKTATTLLKLNKNTMEFTRANSLSESDAVRIDFFRKDLDSIPVLPPGFDKSFTHIILSPAAEQNKRIIEIGYNYQPVDYNDFATYPLISGTTAWKALGEGKATVVSTGTNQGQVVIRKIYLGYFDSLQVQNYLKPIFVFEGDNGFIAYLSAINTEPTPTP